jgi:hypothetical protein
MKKHPKAVLGKENISTLGEDIVYHSQLDKYKFKFIVSPTIKTRDKQRNIHCQAQKC